MTTIDLLELNITQIDFNENVFSIKFNYPNFNVLLGEIRILHILHILHDEDYWFLYLHTPILQNTWYSIKF